VSTPTRILLADDHAVLRQGTAELLRREPDLKVVGEAADGQQAIDMVRTLKPDIVIMDVRMPVLSGIEATRRIRETSPAVQVLVLTAHDDDQYVFSLLEAGASGYLLKTAPIGDLVRAIRQVRDGESPLDPAIARKVVAHFSPDRKSSGPPDEANSPKEGLTAREVEVLQLLARGLNNRAIADELYISDRTVQAHLTSIFSKMAVTSRLEAVMTAIRRGWLTLGS
jgi:NarL family two-component system response regulator LiaR